MLRNTLIAAGLLSISGSALAIDESISHAKPQISISIGGGQHGQHNNYVYRETPHQDVYYRDSYPHDVYLPRPVHVEPIYYTGSYNYQPHGGGYQRGVGHNRYYNEGRGHNRYGDDRRRGRGHDRD